MLYAFDGRGDMPLPIASGSPIVDNVLSGAYVSLMPMLLAGLVREAMHAKGLHFGKTGEMGAGGITRHLR